MRASLRQGCGGSGRRAFTLVELLVVMGIIAVLAAITVGAYQRVVATGRSTACLSNLRQLGAALNLYLGEHQMRMPELKAGRASLEDDVPVLDNTLIKYVETPAAFLCPADNKYGPASGTSYSWNVALNGQPVSNLNFLGVLNEPSKVPIMGDKEGFHQHLKDQVNILYGDGHVTQGLRLSTGS
ncbi:MAG: type II secretion system protein [Chthoniobacteraceae bacterium]